ncbi:MAG: zinc-ribbon domain-containing protein [Promethearchaeota archaeon]|nr:MAG: zinc-ribbon domain-containing protein [Candidatus Lokiarchaeota archaeon]
MVLLQYGDISITFGVISTIIRIIVAVVIANDARSRGMETTGYVLLTCCCGWCIGGIVYLIARSDHQPRDQQGNMQFPPDQSRSQYREPQPGQQSFYGQPDQDLGTLHPQETYRPDSTDNTYRSHSGASQQKYCTMCGASNPIDARFCSNCGSNNFA